MSKTLATPHEETDEHLATKADVERVRAEIAALRYWIAGAAVVIIIAIIIAANTITGHGDARWG